MNAHKKTLLEIHFIHLDNKEICYIFKTCCITFIPPTQHANAAYVIILSFSVQIILTFFINHALKFKHQYGC